MRSHRYVRLPVRRANRRDSRFAFLGGGIALIALVVFTLAALTSVPATQASPNPTATRAITSKGHPGRPAIRLMKKDGGTITADDVAKFVQAAGMPRTLGPQRPITDVQVELLTSAQISVRLHGESTGFADSTPLWFVQMRGTFVFPAPHGRTVTAHIGYQVFDPVTGNIIMFGGLG